jgi:hypothetical protein
MSVTPGDVIEDGQAECHKCGEWYHVTAPRIPHVCRDEVPEWVLIENEARARDGRTLHPGPIPRSAYRNNPYAND